MKKKILLIIDSLKLGGAQTYLSELSKYFLCRNYKVYICGKKDVMINRFPNGITFMDIDFEGRNIVKLFYNSLYLFWQIKKKNITLLHFNVIFPLPFIYLFSKIFCRQIPIVVTIHKIWETETRWFKNLFLNIIYLTLNYVPWAIIVLNSESLALIKKNLICSQNLFLIPNGIEINSNEKESDSLYLKQNIFTFVNDPIIFGYIGRLEYIKRCDLLIKIFYRISLSFPNVRLVIIGTGKEEKKLKKIVENLSLTNLVHFTGFQEKVDGYLNLIDILLITSVSEGISYSMLEALKFGLPIIAYNAPGINVLVKNDYNGFLIQQTNEKLFVEKAIELAKNRNLRKKFSENSKLMVKENFSLNQMGISTEKVYSFVFNLNKQESI